ncbi:MAG: VOC family protein [Pseudomonadota bacterium]
MSILPNSRLSIITLGVKDRAAMAAFYKDVIGLKLYTDEGMTMFDMGGLVLGLWEYDKLAEDAGQPSGSATGFKGTAIAYNTRSVEEVDEIFVRLEKAGVDITTAPHEAFWGGYSGYFADPEGNAWEVAYNPFWKLDEAGHLVLPTGETA